MHKDIQNIYDNSDFFNEYDKMRKTKVNANELLEIPTMKSMLPNLKGKKVLDVGCGNGEMAKFFLELGAKKVVGLDVSENMLNEARTLNNSNNVQFIKLPMEELHTLEEKFDVVISSLAFHYVEDFNKLIYDIYNLLNDGGILLFSQENPITTATILNDKDLKKYTEFNGKRYFLLSDYNNEGKRSIVWVGYDVIKFHRNFSTIVNTLISNKFKILQMEESKPNNKAIELVPKYRYQLDRPLFLFIKAQK